MMCSASTHIILPVLYMVPEHTKMYVPPSNSFLHNIRAKSIKFTVLLGYITHIQMVCKLVTGIHHTNKSF